MWILVFSSFGLVEQHLVDKGFRQPVAWHRVSTLGTDVIKM